MKNKEKYKDELEKKYDELGTFCEEFIIKNFLEPTGRKCNGICCNQCQILLMQWLDEEYTKPEVDWSKVAVDTPIWVKDFKEGNYKKRHFAKYENGKVYAWNEGNTSWTRSGITSWDYAKLAESEKK